MPKSRPKSAITGGLFAARRLRGVTAVTAKIWRGQVEGRSYHERIPVIYQERGLPLLVRLPIYGDNLPVGEDYHHLVLGRQLRWNPEVAAWEVPERRSDVILRRLLAKWDEVHILSAVDAPGCCGPTCENARGLGCRCACLGRNHGIRRGEYLVLNAFEYTGDPGRFVARHLETAEAREARLAAKPAAAEEIEDEADWLKQDPIFDFTPEEDPEEDYL